MHPISVRQAMQRFILRENVNRFQELLIKETDLAVRHTVQSLLLEAQRKLAHTEAVSSGIQYRTLSPLRARGCVGRAQRVISRFRDDFEASASPYLLVDPAPGLHIVDINDAYGRVTMTTRGAIAGEQLFDVFPDNPNDPFADGVNNLYASLGIAAETSRPHTMAIQRYDVRDPTGRFVERYWRPCNTPLFDQEGRLIYLLHHAEDVTDEVLRKRG
jgi:PAS domain-containing protein